MVTAQKNIDATICAILKEAPTFAQAVAILPDLKKVEESPSARTLPKDGTVVFSGQDYSIQIVGGGYYLQRLPNGGWVTYVPPSIFTDSVRQSGA